MFNTSWSILLVDDEPDVLQVSEMVMKDFTVYGLPLELHKASSKAAAIELMNTPLLTPLLPTIPPPRVAVAFIDVVMETDKAGLELCEHIRNTLGNKVTQLFIRTGQPGIAPERDVIDNYDINGYFTKAEATEDKLYSLVKSGARQYLSFVTAHATSAMSTMLSATDSRQALQGFLQSAPIFQRDGHFVFIDGAGLGGSLDEATAKELAGRLDKLPGQPLGNGGDKFVADDEQNMMIKVVGDATKAEAIHVIRGDWQYMPPEVVKNFLHATWTTAATRWKQTG